MNDDQNPEEVLNRGDSFEACRAFREDLSAWIDGELPAERETALRDHLARCVPCQRVREGFTEMDTVLRSLPQPALPVDSQERLRHRIQEEQQEAPAVSSSQVIPLSRARRVRRVAQIAALAAGVAGLALFATHYRGGGERPGVAFVESVGTSVQVEPSDEELLISIETEAIEDLEILEALDVLEKMAQDEQNQGASGGQAS